MYYGWYIVLACAVITSFSWGLGFYGLGVYLDVLRVTHGWPTSLISSAVTVYYLAGAVAVIGIGALVQRHGSRLVIAVGTVAMAGSVVTLGYITRPWHLFAVYLVLSASWAALGAAVISATLVPWFTRRRQGLAMTMALTGPSVAGMVIIPLLVYLTYARGFRTATLIVSALLLACVLPLAALVIKRRPADLGLRPDGADAEGPAPVATAAEREWTRAQALRTPLFWTLVLPFSLALAVQIGFLVHQLSLFEPSLGRMQAAWAVSVTTAAALVGRFAGGMLADRMDRRVVSAANFALQAAALALMAAAPSPAAFYIGSAAFGLGVGNIITLPPLVAYEEFGAPSFASIFAMVTSATQIVGGFGPMIVGVLRDSGVGDPTMLWVLVVIEGVAIAGVLWGRAFRPSSRTS